MICQEDNTFRRERGYHGGLHCTIDPINKATTNKGTTTLFWSEKTKGQPLGNKGTTTLFWSEKQ